MAAERIADPALCRWIAVCKSGRYTIQRPLILGAAIAGRLDLAPAFKRSGAALGEAFQLRDDLIDAFGDSTRSGKPTGLDFRPAEDDPAGRPAMPRDDRVPRLLAGQSTDGATLAQILTDLDMRGEVERRIDDLVERACAAIAAAPLDPGWRDELARFAVQVAYRHK